MKLIGVWLAVIIISLIFFYVGILDGAMITLFIGVVGTASGSICGLSILFIFFAKRK